MMNLADCPKGKDEKPHHGKKWMPAMYVAYFGILQELANAHGYALCVHGSVVRDFDLIAVPFEPKVSPHQDLLNAIREAVGIADVACPDEFTPVGHEPHGRRCYAIPCGAGGYFDISFTPSLMEAVRVVKSDRKKYREIKRMMRTEPMIKL